MEPPRQRDGAGRVPRNHQHPQSVARPSPPLERMEQGDGGYDEEEAWELRREFLEPLVKHCLQSPSAARDSLVFVATNSVHQLRIALGGGYKDYLDGDPIAHGKKPKHLTRAQKELRLKALVSPWNEGADLIAVLQSVDDEPYRMATSDYRNRSSHAIGPRLALGFTQAVTRSVVPATKLMEQADGTFKDEPVPGKMAVSYGFGGTPPLDLEQVRRENLTQYLRARTGYTRYRSLLFLGMGKLPAAI